MTTTPQPLGGDITIMKFANEHKIAKANLRIFSFYLFHKCQLACVKDLNNRDTEACFKMCETGKWERGIY
jgi:hypothetical protein